ncbi:MAG: helix-turn-helix transcriptional regulator [Oscillibacter sp.]|nr:helix-turn-helix transcriptional regulator [Oscillibacter sp.]
MSNQQYTLPREGTSSSGPHLLYISRAQYRQDWNSSLHTHSCAELFFITGGHGRFRTRREDFSVAIHDIVIVNAAVPHTEVSQMDSPLEYIVLGVERLGTLAGAEGYTLVHLLEGWEELMGCLRLMFQEAARTLPGYGEVCRNLLEVVLIRLGRQRDAALSGEAPGPHASRECELVRRYIDNHFKENLHLNQLAEMAHLNKYYLAHAFRREFGVSPINYLISRRIEESRLLLRETDHTLSLIAQILGFSSLSYFSQCFRRVEGISPLEYRRRNRT